MPFNNSTFVQGDLNSKRDGVAFLTVHDIGSNHKPLARFAALPCMEEISSRAVFVHVCVPGQDRGADDFGADFPSMQVQFFQVILEIQLNILGFELWAVEHSFSPEDREGDRTRGGSRGQYSVPSRHAQPG